LIEWKAVACFSDQEQRDVKQQMKLFVGLGNPGKAYAGHRHNIGFMAADQLAARHGFGPWKRAFQGDVCAGTIGLEKIVLLKPQTFMNESGRSVGEAMRFYKLTPADVVVFYDELDLEPNKVRVRLGGGSGGHNGIRSIDAHIGADFWRVRLGIGHPGHKDRVTAYVLGAFAKAEEEGVGVLLYALAAEAPTLAAGDDKRFASDVALRVFPPRPKPEPKPKPPKPDVPDAG
jgi:peptidyl-tRNA hydrolase, PTH1 family